MLTHKQKHWDKYWKNFSVSSSTYATYYLTAQIAHNMIKRSFKKTDLLILDLGYGRCDIAKILCDFLFLSGYRPRIIGVDISTEALQAFCKDECQNAQVLMADASVLPFHDLMFDAVISFGYASVASYKVSEIQREIYRVLKPEDILISDFRNILSLYFVLFKPHLVFKSFIRFLGYGKSSYHFGILGVKKYFSKFGLIIQKNIFTNTFPPIPMHSIEKAFIFIFFDKVFRKIGLGALLGRIFIAVFKKTLSFDI